MGGEFGEEWIHVYVWLSPFAVHPKQSQHCIVMPVLQYKISLKLKKKIKLVQWERMGARDSEFRIDMYTLLYLKWITNKDLLHGTWNSAQCYVAACMGVEFGEEWIHEYVWLSPSAVYLTLSQHHTVMAILRYKITRLKKNLVCH